MTTTPRSGRCRGLRPGWTVMEVLLAAVVLGLVAVGVGRAATEAVRVQRIERYKTVALLIAQNEVERLRAAGPAAATQLGAWRANDAGEPDGGGPYRVALMADTLCNGGVEPGDNLTVAPAIDAGCVGTRATLTYQVRVWYPAVRGRGPEDSLTYALTIGGHARFGGGYAVP